MNIFLLVMHHGGNLMACPKPLNIFLVYCRYVTIVMENGDVEI